MSASVSRSRPVGVYRVFAPVFVFAAALVCFSVGVEDSGLASAYCDPVSRIGAQDEAVYARESIEMAQTGNWLTPTYLGRYALNKPPMLQWLSALSVRVFGIAAWTVRLPSLIAAALTVMLVFLLIRREHSLAAALAGATLLVSSRLFYDFSRLCMTDMLLAFWITAAVAVLSRDPVLARQSSFWFFSACSGAALLTKAAAGALPLLALLLYSVAGPRNRRPALARACWVCAVALAIALPWHIYQLAANPRWFMAEYVRTQHMTIGVTAPPQYSDENHLAFYARRLAVTDPVLAALGAAGLVFSIVTWRRQRITLAWVAVLLAAVFSFRYRSAYYLLPLLPPLAAMAGTAAAALPRRAHAPLLAVLLACAGVKVAAAGAPWAIPAGATAQLPIQPALERYCGLNRGNGLILIDPPDRFYASVLPLARVRYVFAPPVERASGVKPLDFTWLGIAVKAADFNTLDRVKPLYRARLDQFGLHSDEPIATVIWANAAHDLAGIIEAHPKADFWVPAGVLRTLSLSSPHLAQADGAGGMFLLSTQPERYQADRPCAL